VRYLNTESESESGWKTGAGGWWFGGSVGGWFLWWVDT